MLSEIQVFIQVVESNSFYKAANILKMSAASVTRKVAKLEAELGVTLLNRNTRRFSLTLQGEYCYQQCRNISSTLAELQTNIANTVNEPSGTIYFSVSCYSAYMELLPIISRFLEKYPRIHIQLIKTNIYPDLIDDSFDCYLRYKEINTRSLQSIKLIDHQIVCCANPGYIQKNSMPMHPTDLKNHNCIVHQINQYEGNIWDFKRENKSYAITVPSNFRLNNSAMVLEAVQHGVGIARLPSFFIGSQLKSGELIEVLADYPSPKLTVWLVHPRPAYMLRKHKCFVEFLADAYQAL